MKKRHIVGLGLAAVALTGCSSMSTRADETGVRYEGGAMFAQAETYKECQGPSKQEYGDPGDRNYIYPAGERTFKFAEGGDSGPLQVTAKGGVTLTVTGVVTFTPGWMNPDGTVNCDRLRQFHERVGLKFRQAAANAGEDESNAEDKWWRNWMATYVQQPVDRAADAEALNYDWAQLANDGTTKSEWERKVKEGIPAAIQSLGPDAEFITIRGVLLQKPIPPNEVTAEVNRNEAAKLAANTAQTDQQAALNFPGGIEAYQRYQQQKSVNKAIEEGRVPILPVPQGSDVNFNVTR